MSPIGTPSSLFTSSHGFWRIWQNYKDFFFFFGWSAFVHFPIFLLPLNVKCSPSLCLFFIMLFSFSANHHTCWKSSYFPPFCFTKKKRMRRCVSRETKGLFHRLGLNRSRPDIVKENTTLAVRLQNCSLNLTEFKMSDIQNASLHLLQEHFLHINRFKVHKIYIKHSNIKRWAWTFHKISIKAHSPSLIPPSLGPFICLIY